MISKSTSSFVKHRRKETKIPWVEVDREEATSYTYSILDPFAGRIGRRRKWRPKIGIRIKAALADFIFILRLFILKEFSKISFVLRTLMTSQRQ